MIQHSSQPLVTGDMESRRRCVSIPYRGVDIVRGALLEPGQAAQRLEASSCNLVQPYCRNRLFQKQRPLQRRPIGATCPCGAAGQLCGCGKGAGRVQRAVVTRPTYAVDRQHVQHTSILSNASNKELFVSLAGFLINFYRAVFCVSICSTSARLLQRRGTRASSERFAHIEHWTKPKTTTQHATRRSARTGAGLA